MLRRRSDPERSGGAERRGALADALARLDETLRRAERELQAVRSRARGAPAEVQRPPRETPPPVEEAPREASTEEPLSAPTPAEAPVPPAGTVVADSADPAPEPREAEVVSTPTAAPTAATGRAGGDAALFSRQVEVDVGPFGDFGALSSFERAVGKVPGIETVYVRRFFNDRAILELSTADELPLIHVLRAALSSRFDVERSEWDSLKITLRSATAEPG
jgi:hypothetical protein